VTCPNGHSDNGNAGLMQEPDENQILDNMPTLRSPLPSCRRLRPEQAESQAADQQNRFVIIGAGAIVTALLIFVAYLHATSRWDRQVEKSRCDLEDESAVETSNESKSLFPITDSGRPATKEAHQGF